MKSLIKNSLLTAACAFGAFTAMLGGGVLYYVGTAPEAQAGAPRIPEGPSTNPVTPGMQQSLTHDFNAFMTCVGTRRFANLPELQKLEDANNAAGWAAAERYLDRFNTQAAIVRSEIARLSPKYGC